MTKLSQIGEKREEALLTGSRLVHRLTAVVAAIAIAAAIVAAGVYQIKSWQTIERLPLPPEYQAPPVSLPLDQVEARLQPPSNIGVKLYMPALNAAPKQNDLIGAFTANSINGLANWPGDFTIVGGEHANMFERIRFPRVGLRPKAAFITEAEALLASQEPQSRTYHLSVVARDSLGNESPPTDVTFSLRFVPKAKPAPEVEMPRQQPLPAEPTKLTPLQELARDIALTVDPSRSLDYFSAYDKAQKLPARCRAQNHPDFLLAYGTAFNHVQSKLTLANLEGFFNGVCDAWRSALQKIENARAEAQARRDSVERENRERSLREAAEQRASTAQRDQYMIYALWAFLLVVLISLPLSLLAIEKHSRSMRELAEELSRKRSEDNESSKDVAQTLTTPT